MGQLSQFRLLLVVNGGTILWGPQDVSFVPPHPGPLGKTGRRGDGETRRHAWQPRRDNKDDRDDRDQDSETVGVLGE